jgi:hypothetical protein
MGRQRTLLLREFIPWKIMLEIRQTLNDAYFSYACCGIFTRLGWGFRLTPMIGSAATIGDEIITAWWWNPITVTESCRISGNQDHGE